MSHKAKYRIKNVPPEELEPKETRDPLGLLPLLFPCTHFIASFSLHPSFLTFPSILVRAKAAFPTVLWIPHLLLP